MLAHFSTNQPSCNYNVHSPLFFRKIIGIERLPGGAGGRAPGFLASSQTVPRPLSRLCTFETKVAARSRRSKGIIGECDTV